MNSKIRENIDILVRKNASTKEIRMFLEGAYSAASIFRHFDFNRELLEWRATHGIKNGEIVPLDKEDIEIEEI